MKTHHKRFPKTAEKKKITLWPNSLVMKQEINVKQVQNHAAISDLMPNDQCNRKCSHLLALLCDCTSIGMVVLLLCRLQRDLSKYNRQLVTGHSQLTRLYSLCRSQPSLLQNSLLGLLKDQLIFYICLYLEYFFRVRG